MGNNSLDLTAGAVMTQPDENLNGFGGLLFRSNGRVDVMLPGMTPNDTPNIEQALAMALSLRLLHDPTFAAECLAWMLEFQEQKDAEEEVSAAYKTDGRLH